MPQCHDCKKEIKTGFTLFYKDGDNKIQVYKCKSCYKNNPSLNNFRKTEVFSRIVGYYRPTRSWNVAKKQEFGERVVFKPKIHTDKAVL